MMSMFGQIDRLSFHWPVALSMLGLPLPMIGNLCMGMQALHPVYGPLRDLSGPVVRESNHDNFSQPMGLIWSSLALPLELAFGMQKFL
jgi:hypothetical protein